jgi:CubicO group peptidase (beta-lactamase class C family)
MAGRDRLGGQRYEDIAEPLGVADQMYVGIPDGIEDRLATLQTLESEFEFPVPDDHDFFKAMPRESNVDWNSLRVRKACLPSANGHFSARALARMYGALANGGEIDGVRLVSPERIGLMSRIVTEEADRVIFITIPKGGGFMMGGPIKSPFGEGPSATGPRRTAFGHAGAGGSTAFADPEVGLSIGVTLNKMQNTLQAEGPVTEVCQLIRRELGVNG